jgi:hypothetical protein
MCVALVFFAPCEASTRVVSGTWCCGCVACGRGWRLPFSLRDSAL